MAGATNYVEQNFLNWYFRRGTWLATYTPYTRLYTAVPDFEAGTGGTELSGTGYAAGGQAAARGSTNWNNPAAQGNGYRLTNKAVSAFVWTAGSDWAAITGAAIWDTNSGGNMLWGKALDANRDLANGDTFRLHNGSTGLMNFDIDVTAAAGLTNEAKQALLNHLFISDQTANQVPATAYIAVYTTLPNKYTGAGGTEVSTSGTNYARLAITSSSAWNAASTSGTGYLIDNAAAFNGWSAAGTAWGSCVGCALVDTASGAIGHYYAIDDHTAVQIDAGDTYSIAAGAFDISFDESN